MRRWIVAALAAALTGCAAVEPTSQPGSQPASQPGAPAGVQLGKRYFNLAESYSLCPPAEANRVQQRLASRTVTWTAIDRTRGGLAWVLAAARVPTPLTTEQLAGFVEEARKGALQDKVAAESCRVITAAGRPAIDLCGVRTDRKGTWTREVFVLAEEGEFLTLTILGPAAKRQKLLAVHQAVLDSLELLDRQALAARREANLAAGRELLGALTAERLPELIEPEDRWMLILRDGQVEGFMAARDRCAEIDGRAGVEGRAWMRVTQPDGTVQRVEVVSFAAADRSVERWTATVRATAVDQETGQPRDQVLVVRLAKQGPSIELSETLDGEEGSPAQMVLGEAMDRSYLPMVMQPMVQRLADLRTAASYAFAAFAPRANELDVHTFTVVGPEEIDWDGQKVQAIRAAVRSAEDEEAQDVWLDPSGRLLRQRLAAGAFLERSTRGEVLRRFPEAREMLKAIDAAASPASRPVAAGEEAR